MIHWDLLLLQSRRRHNRGRMEEAGDVKRSFVIFNAPPETTERPTARIPHSFPFFRSAAHATIDFAKNNETKNHC